MTLLLYKTRLKCLFRNKGNMFWCYLFPIMMASCLYFACNNLWKVEDFKTVSIAYDSQGDKEDALGEVLSATKINEEQPMFNVEYCSAEEAGKLLENGEIEAYIVGSENPELHVKAKSLNATIIKSFLDNYLQASDAVAGILKENPKALQEGLLDDLMQRSEFVEEAKAKNKPQSLLVYFYALLAYTCIFAANWGLDEVVNIQADLSHRGARLNVSPMNKMKLFFSNLLAAFTAHIISIILLFLYMYYIIRINFGDNLAYLFGICLLGSLCGVALGACVGVWVRKKTETKEAILTFVVLVGAFLAGMMSYQMKYIVMEKLPILGYLNPVNLIADAMYSLYYYDTYNRFYLDAAILCVFTVLLCVASYMGIRRKNYASI